MRYPEISNVAKETICILACFDNSFVSKIPSNFLNEMKNLSKDSNIIVKIDKNKKLEKQNILEETKDMISLIYYSYIATREEKEELKRIWNNNELLYKKELEEKYNHNNIFNKSKEDKENKLMVIDNKEGMLEKLKKFFINLLKNTN